MWRTSGGALPRASRREMAKCPCTTRFPAPYWPLLIWASNSSLALRWIQWVTQSQPVGWPLSLEAQPAAGLGTDEQNHFVVIAHALGEDAGCLTLVEQTFQVDPTNLVIVVAGERHQLRGGGGIVDPGLEAGRAPGLLLDLLQLTHQLEPGHHQGCHGGQPDHDPRGHLDEPPDGEWPVTGRAAGGGAHGAPGSRRCSSAGPGPYTPSPFFQPV